MSKSTIRFRLEQIAQTLGVSPEAFDGLDAVDDVTDEDPPHFAEQSLQLLAYFRRIKQPHDRSHLLETARLLASK
jgi:hypothetical protein